MVFQTMHPFHLIQTADWGGGWVVNTGLQYAGGWQHSSGDLPAQKFNDILQRDGVNKTLQKQHDCQVRVSQVKL